MRVEKKTLASYKSSKNNKAAKTATVLFIVIALVAGFFLGQKFHSFLQYGSFNTSSLDYSSLDEIYNIIKNTYDGPIDNSKLIEGAKKGMVASLGDDYTTYFTSEEAKIFLNDMEGSFEGIGAELGAVDGALAVVWLIDGSPATQNGLQSGDIIAKVDGENSLGWSPEYAATRIRGEAGSVVTLTIIRGQDTLEKSITRAKINAPSVRYEIKDGNIGYVHISRFGETDTVDLMRKAAKDFVDNKVKGIVLDLRNNGGGYVDAARDVASLWLDKDATIAMERGMFTPETRLYSTGLATLSGIRTVILVNDYTASASEILAGALRDNGKATLIGTKTYGKGVVQSVKEFPSGALLKITSARWYTPQGSNIDHSGLEPDVILDFDANAYQKDGSDNQLTKALELIVE